MMHKNLLIEHNRTSSKHPSSDEENFEGLRINVFDNPNDILIQWRALEDYSDSPFSSVAWACAWYTAHNQSPDSRAVIIYGECENGKPAFILPLFQKKVGPVYVLVRPGFKHSAYFNGLFSQEITTKINPKNAHHFWSLVFDAIPRIDAVLIDGISQSGQELDYPLKYLPLIKSQSSSFRQSISANWAQQYRMKNSAKVRSNDRRCEKRLSELGTLEYCVAATPREKRHLLDQLFSQKSKQFESMNTGNPYAETEIQKFYEELAVSEDNQSLQTLFISTLVLNGEPLAINLGVVHSKVLHGLVLSMTPSPLKRFAPGRLLLNKTNQYLSETGIESHDFGVGDLSYKNDWCEECVKRFHVLAPLNVQGEILVICIRLAAFIKSKINHRAVMQKINYFLSFKDLIPKFYIQK